MLVPTYQELQVDRNETVELLAETVVPRQTKLIRQALPGGLMQVRGVGQHAVEVEHDALEWPRERHRR